MNQKCPKTRKNPIFGNSRFFLIFALATNICPSVAQFLSRLFVERTATSEFTIKKIGEKFLVEST